tara:strand:- start:184 stop:1185 length:1002 start_codon:yes stop_codon:yes gene_type:complete
MNFTTKQKSYSILLFFILLFSYFSFFDDYFKYLEVKKNRTSDSCISYYLDFPNGYYTEDVKVIEIEDSRDIVLVRAFINDYPNSNYSSIVNLINLEIWNEEISRYNSVVTSNSNLEKDAVEFFRTMLIYMRERNKSKIFLDLTGIIDLKDFDDYPKEVINMMNQLTLDYDNRNTSDNIANITNNYSEGFIKDYEKIIIESIDSSFENILSNNFINVESSDKINPLSTNDLLIKISYNIKNQNMSEYGFPNMPNIWIYEEQETNNFLSYLIGVSIKFEFDFSLPINNQKYTFSYEANPLENVNNITSLESGYKEMTKQNFQDFSNTIANKFGIY